MIPKISEIRPIRYTKKYITLSVDKEKRENEEAVSLVEEALGQNIDTYA